MTENTAPAPELAALPEGAALFLSGFATAHATHPAGAELPEQDHPSEE